MFNENCTMGTQSQTPMEAATDSLHRNLRIISDMAEGIVEKLRGPQLEKTEGGVTPMAPGLLGTMDDYTNTTERIIKKLSLALETL